MIGTALAVLGGPIGTLIDRLVPDQHEAARMKLEMEQALVEASTQSAIEQSKTNQVEAAHRNVWVAGWRPAIGWTCAAALFYAFVGHDLLTWIAMVTEADIPMPPAPSTDVLFELTLAMLGLGGLRTFEKLKGVAK